MVDGLLEKRFKEASVLPLWLHLGPASAYETRPTDKACMLFWRELKSCCQSRPVTSVAFKVAIDNTRVKPKTWDDFKLTQTLYQSNLSSGVVE